LDLFVQVGALAPKTALRPFLRSGSLSPLETRARPEGVPLGKIESKHLLSTGDGECTKVSERIFRTWRRRFAPRWSPPTVGK
jgi:hypothetical protein